MQNNERMARDRLARDGMFYIKLTLGLVLVVAALVMILTASDKERFTGGRILLSIAGFPLPWQLTLTPILVALGTYLVLSVNRSFRVLMLALLTWIGVYVLYMVGLWVTGHSFVLQGFNFSKIGDLLYLILLSVLIGLVLRIQLDITTSSDLHGLYIAIAIVLFTMVIMSSESLFGIVLRPIIFTLGVPSYIVIILSIISLLINFLRSVWWEIRRRPPQLGESK